MSNSYFQFKQFIIHQQNSPLKVTTDSCLLGALADAENANSILDVGTGTGLLALMLAQKSSGFIQAVEIDEQSFFNAKKNFELSIWNHRIKIDLNDINDWSKNNKSKFDLIVCNPPYFTSHKKNNDVRKSIARHNDSLSHATLINIFLTHLEKSGRAFILLPPDEMNNFISCCTMKKIYPEKKIIIRSSENKAPHLFVVSFSFFQTAVFEEQIFIQKNNKEYSDRFMELLSPYYLDL